MFAMFARKGAAVSVATGVARIGRRTKELTRHLQPGDVAVIDHEDLDRVAAEGLVNRRVGGVVNAAACLSGRYPNVGPLLLAAAGIPIVDRVGSEVLDLISDGQEIRLEGNEIWHDGVMVASGVRQDLETLERDYEAAKLAIGAELERFAENTLEYLREEHQSVLGSLSLPDLKTKLQGRQVLVVVRGADYRDDLAHLRSYVREIRPVLVGVDGGADALLEFGLKPHLILGDFDSVSDQALRCGAELVVHAYPGGNAPGAARLEALDVPHLTVEASGTSEDVAMLLAYEHGAELIVAVGSHASMVDFLDKGRGGMASTFLTRLKIGQVLVDAKGVSKLYESRIRKRDLIFFLLAAMLCFVVVVVAVFPRVFLDSFWLLVRESWRSLSQ